MIGQQISTYLDHLVVERGSAPNTVSSYRRDLARYERFLSGYGITDLAKVTENDITEFVLYLRRGDDEFAALAASSAARTLIAVRGLHRFALAEGMVERNVASEVKPPQPAKRLPKSLPVDQVVALLESASIAGPDAPRGLRDRALLELLYSTGARISEAVGLDVDDIDTEARSVLLRGKGGKHRIVPVGRPTDTSCAGDRDWRPDRTRHCFSTCGAAGFLDRARGRCCRIRPSGPELPPVSHHMFFGTRSPPIYSTAVPTFASCRSSWVTRR